MDIKITERDILVSRNERIAQAYKLIEHSNNAHIDDEEFKLAQTVVAAMEAWSDKVENAVFGDDPPERPFGRLRIVK